MRIWRPTRFHLTARVKWQRKDTVRPILKRLHWKPSLCASAMSMGPGRGHKDSAVAKFIRQAISGKPLKIYGDGSQTRDFLYIDDLVEAVIKAATVPGIGGEVFQIATGTETAVSDILNLLNSILRECGCEHTTITRASMRPGDVKRNFSDPSKALRVLDWQAEWTLSDGLRETVKWFLNLC